MKISKVTTLILALCTALILSSCGASTGGSSAPTTAPATAATAAQTTAKATTTAAAQQTTTPAAPEKLPPLELTFVSPNWEDAPDFNNEWYTRFFAETNTKWSINFIPSNDYSTKYDLILSSGDLPDILMSEDANRPTTVQAIQNGAFWNLSPILGDFSGYPNLKNNPTKNAFKYASYSGNIYAIPRSRPQVDPGIAIRKDWLEKLGLQMPTTVDEYREVLKTIVAADPSGHGTIGLVGWGYSISGAAGPLRHAFGLNTTAKDENGGMVHTNLKDEMADFVEYVKSLYDAGVISKEFAVMKNTQAEDIIISGRAASYGYNIWRDYDYSQKAKVNQPEAEFEQILPMKGPKGTTALLEKGVYGYFHINAKLPEAKVRRIIDFYEYACAEDMTLKGYYGWEGVHFNFDDKGTRVMTDVGRREIGTGIQQPLPMIANTWAKVVCVTAPKDYNDAKLARVQVIADTGSINPFSTIASKAWTDAYPKIQSEYDENYVLTVVGEMSVDDFRAFLAEQRAKPEFKQAFKEFAELYDAIFG